MKKDIIEIVKGEKIVIVKPVNFEDKERRIFLEKTAEMIVSGRGAVFIDESIEIKVI